MTFFISLALMIFAPSTAMAYIGPGLGVTLAWTLLGPIAAFVTGIGIVIYFPLRYIYRRHKAKNAMTRRQGRDIK